MPTAVERFLQRFLKLEIDNGFEYGGLNKAFAELDADLSKLQSATDLSPRAFHRLEESLAPVFWKISGAYYETGENLSRIAGFASALDSFFIKLSSAPATTASATAQSTTPPVTVATLQDDFVTLDTALSTSGADLKIFGGDFLKIDRLVSAADFTVKLHGAGADASTLAGDFAANQATFATLAADFLKIGANVDGESTNQDHKISFELGTDLKIIAADFGRLVDDFKTLAGALGGPSDVPPVLNVSETGGQQVLSPSPSSAFIAATDDFLKLSHDLTALAHPTAQGITALIQKAYGGGGGTAFP